MAEIRITVNRNGSYYIQGKPVLVDHKGNEIPYDGDELWLCRCGKSATKPFCDGSHRQVWGKGSPDRPNP